MMSPTRTTTTAVLIIVLLSSETVLSSGDASSSFDIFEFSLVNPAGLCSSANANCTKSHMGSGQKRWTIQGLWPAYANGTDGPENCSNSHFNLTDLNAIRSTLNNVWPSYTHRTNDELWQDEFKRYGSCASQHPHPNSTLPYFTQALDLYRLYDVGSWLEKAGIQPSDTKPRHIFELKGAIFTHFTSGNFDFLCDGSRNGSEILQRIVLCVDRTTNKPAQCHWNGNICRTGSVWYLGSSSGSTQPSSLLLLAVATVAMVLVIK